MLDFKQSPFFLRDSRASEKGVRVKITPREKSETQQDGLSRVGWFSRALAFHSLYYPWRKMGTTHSLNHAGLVEKLTETSQKSASLHPSWRFSSLSQIRCFWGKGRRERQKVKRSKGKKHYSHLPPQISSLITPKEGLIWLRLKVELGKKRKTILVTEMWATNQFNLNKYLIILSF